MQHPFINDLSQKSLEEIQTTIQDLYSKLNFAYRTHNQALVNQLYMVIESYKNESNKRLDQLYKKQNIDNHINISGKQ